MQLKKLGIPVGIVVGVLNSLLGAGGGMLVVPTLKAQGLSQKEAQATAISVILPLCLVSAVFYLVRGETVLKDALIYMPFGIIGGAIGALLLPKISGKILNVAFGIFLIYSAVRMFLK